MPIANSSPLRLALVGVGPWGTLLAQKFTQAGAEIVHHVRQNGPDVEHWGSRVPLDALWEANDLSGVLLATPPHLTLPLAHKAATAGLAVLACKPLWLEEPLVLRAPFFVDYVRLWSPAYALLKTKVHGHRIRRIDAVFVGKGPYRNFSCLDDYGSHLLALTHDLLGHESMPTHVVASAGPQDDAGGTVHHVRGVFNNEVPFALKTGNGAPDKHMRFTVEVDDVGSLQYEEKGGKVSLTLDGDTLLAQAHDPLMSMTTTFIEQCRQGVFNTQFVDLSVAVDRSLKTIHQAENSQLRPIHN